MERDGNEGKGRLHEEGEREEADGGGRGNLVGWGIWRGGIGGGGGGREGKGRKAGKNWSLNGTEWVGDAELFRSCVSLLGKDVDDHDTGARFGREGGGDLEGWVK